MGLVLIIWLRFWRLTPPSGETPVYDVTITWLGQFDELSKPWIRKLLEGYSSRVLNAKSLISNQINFGCRISVRE